jgi:hypothetical protein
MSIWMILRGGMKSAYQVWNGERTRGVATDRGSYAKDDMPRIQSDFVRTAVSRGSGASRGHYHAG